MLLKKTYPRTPSGDPGTRLLSNVKKGYVRGQLPAPEPDANSNCAAPQCTLAGSRPFWRIAAMATLRLSITVIGVPSAAWMA